jgi:CubicO group peptidase (beta-lactamase class C family)
MTKGMRIRGLIVTAISLALVIAVFKINTTTGVEKGGSLESFTAHLDKRVPVLMKAYDIPGVNIALVKEGETVWLKTYGYAELETGRKMTTDTHLRVQSISKPVTAWGVMKLAEQGKIELDSPVKQYIKNWSFPQSRFAVDKITVRQLLSHTAGMPLGDIFNLYSPQEEIPSLEESLSREAVLIREPGSSFSYSNTGFNLLELLIEEVTGRDFAQYMEQEVLIPLGMYDSGFIWSEELDPPVPYGYDLSGNPVPMYVYPEKASGGLIAGVRDIAAFVAAGMPGFSQNHTVLSPRTIDTLYTPVADNLGVYSLVFDSYGLGYYLENLAGGKQAVSHGGQGSGWMTHFHAVPETGDGVVILTNSQRSWPFIAYLLNDWARWSGLSSLGMSRIIWGNYGLWMLVVLIWAVVLLQMGRLSKVMIAIKYKNVVPAKKSPLRRLGQSSLSVVLTAGLLWCLNQDYLFISSVFPVSSGWLGISVLAFAVSLLLSALLPWQKAGPSPKINIL